MTKRKSEFNYTVTVLREDGSHGCSLCSGQTDLGSSVAAAFRDVAFYLREGHGYPAVILRMDEVCGECHGSGYLHRTARRSKKCPACKAVGVFGTLFETKIERPRALTIVERAA